MVVDLTDVYRGPLEKFVERRTRLAREARGSDPAAAAAIGRLPKPSVWVWAIDQVAIERRELIVELLAAGADARDTQLAVAVQGATRESLVVASARLRDAVEAAAGAANDVLETAARPRNEQTSCRIRATLQSVATGAAGDRLALLHGTLDHEVESAGFGAVDRADGDPAELADVLAPLRRPPAATGSAQATRAPVNNDREQRAAAERAAKKQEEAAQRLRDLANAKRIHAETLAEEARRADHEASAAQEVAENAEAEARVLRSTLT